MILRGGSSKGAYFTAGDLPTDPTERDDLLLRIVGSPDARQIDGIGGAHPLTSKVAIVGLADEPGADLDYLFLQVAIDEPLVSDRQNCGNLLAGVAPFALERGLITPDPGATDVSVRIRMLNTGSIATATVSVSNGMPIYDGDTAISGVPGTAAAIRIDFADIAGGSCGSLLPTGNVRDTVAGVECTMVDNGMPVVVMRADALGVTGRETCAVLEANAELRARLETIRIEAGRLMNLGDVTSSTIPKLTMVSSPLDGGHLNTRTFIPHRCHEAIGVLGAVSVATAARLPGSPANELLASPPKDDRVLLEHPSGDFEAVVAVGAGFDGAGFDGVGFDDAGVGSAGIIRTARKLMDGTVYPRG